MTQFNTSPAYARYSIFTRGLHLAILMLIVGTSARAQLSYSFATSTTTYANIVGGTNVVVGANATAFLANDAQSDVIPLGFTFQYNGTNVTQVRANTNGWLAMSTGLSPNANQSKNNVINAPNGQVTPSICPLWDDLSGVGGTATYLTTGTAPNRVFTIEWRNWRWDAAAAGAVISFKCALYETTNVIEFTYAPGATAVNNASGGASIGLTSSTTGPYYSLNGTGTNPTASITVGTNNLSTRPASGQVYRFTPCTVPAITSTSSNSPVCSTNNLTLSVVATGTTPSYAWSGVGTISNGTTANASVTGAGTGNYSVVVSNGCGTASATVPVTVTPLPAATIQYTGSPYCSNAGSATVTRTGTANGTYSSTAGLSLAGSTGTITLGTSTPGTYTVMYTMGASGGCPQVTTQTTATIQAASTWYADVDNDGAGDPGSSVLACSQPVGHVANNTDGCPSDPNKVAPGICGCGVADTDSDGDGTANCNDGCPNDPNKIAPGICGCGVADTDSDGDGTANCNDGCPNDPNKIAPGICGCGMADTDSDGDGTANCNDLCPNDPNKIAPGVCGCGVADTDSDGDGTANCNDGCPSDPNKIAPGICGCGVADTDSDGDGTANCNDGCPNDPNKVAPGICGCGVADTDSDGDGTADCIDLCAADPLKVTPGQCGCGNLDTDSDGDGTADCNDACPNDPNKIAPGVCGCGVADVATTWYADTDGDGFGDPSSPLAGYTCDTPAGHVANNGDDCPSVFGLIGSSCTDNNPFTTGDVLNASCACVGTPVPCDNWTLKVTADGNGNEITWQIIDANSPFVLASGGPYINNSTNTTTVCIPQGASFKLVMNDAGGNGFPGGGWLLKDETGKRIVDNEGNGGNFTSTCTTGTPFTNEGANNQVLIAAHQDRENWLITDIVIASANPSVSAQWGVGNQTDDGYEFWFEDPCGGYSRRVFRNHANSGGTGPANSIRATKLKLNSLFTAPIPEGTFLNVRVRTRVNGVNGTWGPASRFKVDPNACTPTKLNDTPSDPNFSCGATGKVVGGSGQTGKIYAKVVTSGGNPATNYRFRLSEPGEGYLRMITSPNAALVLSQWYTAPLLCGTYTYDVQVAASFDNGATYCPFGVTCSVEITNPFTQHCTNTYGGGQDDRAPLVAGMAVSLYPNPNRGDEVFISLSDLERTLTAVNVDVYDTFGKLVLSRTMAAADGTMNGRIELRQDLAAGLYMVNIRAGEETRTERLLIQH